MDTSGRVISVNRSSANINTFSLQITAFKCPVTPFLSDVEARVDRLLPELFPKAGDQNFQRKMVLSSYQVLQDSFKHYFDYQMIYGLMEPKSQAVIKYLNDTPTSFLFSPNRLPEIWLFKRNVANSALLGYYNANKVDSLPVYWVRLYHVQKKLYTLQDLILQMKSIKNNARFQHELTGQAHLLYKQVRLELIALPSMTQQFNRWMLAWLGFLDDRWRIAPLNIIDKMALQVLSDTTVLKSRIEEVNLILTSEQYNQTYYYQQQRKANLESRLSKLRDYAEQAQISEKVKSAFTEFNVISQVKLPADCDYQVFHDFKSQLQIMDNSHLKDDDISNDEKVCFTVVNIPFNRKVTVEKTSTGFILNKQANGIISQVLDNFIFKSNDFDAFRKESPDIVAMDTIWEKIHLYLDLLEPYLTYLPPVAKMTFSDKVEFSGFKTQPDAIGPHEGDSAMNNTYSITISTSDRSEEPPMKGIFKYKSYKKSRIQFTTGAHLFTGNAPVVKKTTDGINTFILTSDKALRYSAGIKVYALRQTFSDIKTWAKFKEKVLSSWHGMVAVDLTKPLDNFYAGVGVDLLPGLGLDVMSHLYSYTKYSVFNGQVVSELKTYKVRNGCSIAITMDGSVLNKVFTSFLKIK